MNQTLLNVCGNFPMAAGVQPICARDLPPEIALKGAVLDSLGDVVGGDGFRAAEVGDGAGDVQDAGGCAGGEGEIFHRDAPEVFRVCSGHRISRQHCGKLSGITLAAKFAET